MSTDEELRDTVARLIARATCSSGVLWVGSSEWWDAPATVQLGSVAALALENLPCAEKQASVAISGALDWRAEADVPTFEELRRRRAQPGPLAKLAWDPDAAARWVDPDAAPRWVATGSSEETAVA